MNLFECVVYIYQISAHHLLIFSGVKKKQFDSVIYYKVLYHKVDLKYKNS